MKRARRHQIRRASFALLAASGLAGCQLIAGITERAAGPVARSCLHNSDCPDEFACLFQTCAERCKKDVDCDVNYRCLETALGVACVSSAQPACPATPCPKGTVCADEVCRVSCEDASSCRADQDCSASVCVGTDSSHDPASLISMAGGAGMEGGGAGGGGPGNGGDGGSGVKGGGSGGSLSNGGSAGTGALATGGAVGSAGSSATMAGAGGADGSSGRGGSAGRGASGSAGNGTGGAAGTGGGEVIEVSPSPGCGKGSATDGPGSIDVSGTQRDYILRLPSGYDGMTPSRLVFAFHAAMGSADQVDNGDPSGTGLYPTGPYFGIRDLADAQTIFVAGQALTGGWTNESGRDIDYVSALLVHFEDELCIDRNRVFATGFSFGAIMANTIGSELAGVFRAVGSMSGSPVGSTSSPPVAYWASHGTEDSTIPLVKGEAARDEFVARNHCSSGTTSVPSNGCLVYQGCDPGYPVTWCEFDGIHEPPAFAGPELWNFLSRL